MNDQIELRLTPHEYAYGHILQQWIMPLRHRRAWVFVSLAVLLGLVLQNLSDLHYAPSSYAIGFAIIVPAWLTKEYLFVYNHFRKTGLPLCRILLCEQGLHYQYPGFDHLYEWREMRGLNASGGLAFLRLGGRRFLLLSQRAFRTKEHFLDWQQCIHRHLKISTKVEI